MDAYNTWIACMRDLTQMDCELANGTSKWTGKDREKTIHHLIGSLRRFGEGQFRFFSDGFDKTNHFPYPQLEIVLNNPPKQYDPSEVIKSVVKKIEDDVARIILAADQRAGSRGADAKEFLKLTDKLASAVLWPARTSQPTDGVPIFQDPQPESESFGDDFEIKTILTYYHDQEDGSSSLPTIRIVPYSQVALIGLPIECKDDLTRLLAIPHELGHFRFWYSYCKNYDEKFQCVESGVRLNVREDLYDYSLDPSPLHYPPWREEIFADIYAIVLGGPIGILTAQELAVRKGVADLTKFEALDDTKLHPAPFLRPLIQLKALNNLPARLLSLPRKTVPDKTDLIIMLLSRWQKKLAALTSGATILDYDLGLGQFVNPARQAWVNKLMSPGLGLVTGQDAPPVDQQIQKAFDALVAIFDSVQALPRSDWGWASHLNSWNVLPELEAQLADANVDKIKRPLWKLLAAAPEVDERWLDTFNKCPKFDRDSQAIPQLWQDWVLKVKAYLTTLTWGATEIKSGDRTDMDGKIQDKWIRVYAASGWDTHGPCTTPPH